MRIRHDVLTGGIACALLGAVVVHGINAQSNKRDPAADWPAGVLGLGATVVTNKRRIASDDFFRGMYETALDIACKSF